MRGAFQSTGLTRAGKAFLLPVPPAGTYVFRYSLYSGKGGWAAAKSYRDGMAFSNPLMAVSSVDDLAEKPLPPTHSFCSLGADNLVLTALKKSERDNAIILRVVEMDGAKAETPVQFLGSTRSFRPANLIEEESTPTAVQALRVNPYEISTVRLLLK